MTGFGEDIRSQFAGADASFDGARRVGSKNIRNISAEARAHREEEAFRRADGKHGSGLAVPLPTASGGAGSMLTAQELFDDAAKYGQLPAWLSSKE